MTRTAYDVFLRELDSIEELYVLSLWAYRHREGVPSDKNVVSNPDRTLSIGMPGFPRVGKYRNLGHIKAELLRGLPRRLRSVLYVRVISALEMFLIDSIKFAFAKNPFLLASQKRLEIPHSRLIAARTLSELQWEILSKETRRLHAAGFAEVVKFYNSQLGINLSDTGINLARLERAHDMRHLLVHRLGRTDEQFKEKYGEKRGRIWVTDEDLADLISDCRNVAVRLSNRLEERINATPLPQGSQPFVGEITVRLHVDDMPPELLPDFSFVKGDQYFRNSEIFKLHNLPEGMVQYVFQCPYEHYAIVRRKLKNAAKRGTLEIVSIRGVSGIPKKRSSQSKDYLLNVAVMLPKRSEWYKGIHKNLAKIIGISNNKANRIITSILEDRECLDALGKNTHKDLKTTNGIESNE